MSKILRSLQGALTKINALFSNQCTALAKIKPEIEEGEFCCGQFLGPGAAAIPQRGIHGLASAIRVLSNEPNDETIKIVKGLVFSTRKYVNNYPADLKTIKLAELLFSLKKVKLGLEKDEPIEALSDLIVSAKQKNGQFGWPFLIDPANPKAGETFLLASIYVYQALWDPGNTGRTNDVLTYIEESIETYFKEKRKEKDVELYTIIFALYVITFQSGELSRTKEDAYKSFLKKIQKAIGQTICEDSEQNIEYWDHNRSYYIRIPWQLYLFALVARFRTYQLYQSQYRSRVIDICSRISDGKFIYPHAGRLLSSRTHAIAFECLTQIKELLSSIPLRDQVWFSTKGWLLSRIGKVIVALVVFGLISYFYIKGIAAAGLDIKSLVTELNGSFISFVVLWCLSVFGWFKRIST